VPHDAGPRQHFVDASKAITPTRAYEEDCQREPEHCGADLCPTLPCRHVVPLDLRHRSQDGQHDSLRQGPEDRRSCEHRCKPRTLAIDVDHPEAADGFAKARAPCPFTNTEVENRGDKRRCC
jgi:hypothetical protein